MMISTREAAVRLSVSTATIRRWAASGRLRFMWVGRFRAFETREVARLGRLRRVRTCVQDRRRAPAVFLTNTEGPLGEPR